ncbi:MAG: M3 family metallopeptidase [Woeseiaceae bacterium]|nr:M3 family metallopeptidase [Woeseiaceae bacterium]
MTNPLLATDDLPRFDEIQPRHTLPALRELIESHRQKLDALTAETAAHDFESLVMPLEEMQHELRRAWSPVSHLQGVLGDSQWRDVFNEALPLLTRHDTEIAQNKALHDAYRHVAETLPDDAPPEQRMLVDHALRDFRLGGVALPDGHKAEFGRIRQELATLQAGFEQNIQDSTDHWHLHVTDEGRLAGLPRSVVERARRAAADKDLHGFHLTLDFPTWLAVSTHADDRALRETFYVAWSTRASEQAADPQWDNSERIEQILALRHRMANLVGFENFGEYSLATKMASDTTEVIEFLRELARKTRPAAEREMAQLEELAPHELAPWDVPYWLEKLKQERYSVSDELLRRYFPANRVVDGLFALAHRLYGVSLEPRDDVQVWDPAVRYYDVLDDDGRAVGGFYTDLHARPGKRSGAWIDECIVRKNLGGEHVAPVGYLVCNFEPPNEAGVSLLTHTDVVTLFHEFGHMLHHLLTRVDYPALAGINGVPWDAVELPSQFMENFAWNRDVLASASGHYETGEPLPHDMFERLLESRHCGAGLAMLRQIEFALFDFRVHAEYDAEQGARALEIIEDVRNEVALVRHPEYNRFPHSFSHIFAGGYAAGYYSYKWAEVLAADAFAAFEERGIFDKGTAMRFRREILEVGGSRDIMQAFVAFRGRKPTLDALLRQSGIDKAA